MKARNSRSSLSKFEFSDMDQEILEEIKAHLSRFPMQYTLHEHVVGMILLDIPMVLVPRRY